MKNLARHLTIILLALFIVGCSKDDGDKSSPIPENEKLLKSATLSSYGKFNYEYNPDKTLRTIDVNLMENGNQKYSFEYTKGNLTVLKTWGNNGIKTCVYTYDANNKITSFKIGDNPAILVDYFDDLDRYVWKKNNVIRELRLNTSGDLLRFRTEHDDGEVNTNDFVYVDAKKGGFSNSKILTPQLLMQDEGTGAIFVYGAGMTYKPLEYFGSTNTGYMFNNQYDNQGFITKTNVENAQFEFEYFKP